MHLLQTERTYLRRFEKSDLDQIIEMESDPKVMEKTGPGRAQTDEESNARLDKILRHRSISDFDGYFAVIEKKTDLLIAWFMLLPITDKDYEIGFMVNQSYWGKGFGLEVCRELSSKAILCDHIEKIIAKVSASNTASKKLLQKCLFIKIQSEKELETYQLLK